MAVLSRSDLGVQSFLANSDFVAISRECLYANHLADASQMERDEVGRIKEDGNAYTANDRTWLLSEKIITRYNSRLDVPEQNKSDPKVALLWRGKAISCPSWLLAWPALPQESPPREPQRCQKHLQPHWPARQKGLCQERTSASQKPLCLQAS